MRKCLAFLIILLPLLIHLSIDNAFCQTEREQWQPPEQIMDSIGVKPGMIIGEPGAGRGYFTFHLSKRVGEKGKVYANDISRSSLNEIDMRAKREGINNIEIVLGEIEDPLFPVKDLDMIIMVYVLHMLDKPLSFMENIKKYMKDDTPLVIIERDTHRERAHPPSFMTKKQILESLQKTEYELERVETFLPRDTIYIFKLKK
ncbi:MAG: methyltransferase domain-containing protein [Gemmatimonadota bacterium]|nr:MAG: methyltransferase domain-containing protein [Gemmatimonadota bacterium]